MEKLEITKAHGGFIVERFNEDDEVFVNLSDVVNYIKNYFSEDCIEESSLGCKAKKPRE